MLKRIEILQNIVESVLNAIKILAITCQHAYVASKSIDFVSSCKFCSKTPLIASQTH